MQVEGRVGPIIAADSGLQPFRLDRTGAQVVTDAHPRFGEAALRGTLFSVASQAVATTTVGLATTYTGLVLSNPVTSPVNLVLIRATLMQSVIQATQPEAYAIAYGYSPNTNVTHSTPATPQPTRIGSGATPSAKADTSATLPVAPLYGEFVSQTSTATAQPTQASILFDGSTVLLPGAYALWVTPAQASVAGMWFSFLWEEVAI